MKVRLKKIILNALWLSFTALPVLGEKQADPNILFILTDDLGYADVGFMGASDVQTPVLDSLADEGLVMTRHYAMHICSPTRGALMTGRHPMRYGLQQSVYHPSTKSGLPLDEVILPQMLKNAGYKTYAFGKWHLGIEEGHKPHERGFDYYYGSLGGQLDYNTHIYLGAIDWWRNDELLNEPGYTTTLLGEDAARIIRKEAGSAPLFVYLSFNAPHSPYIAPPEVVAKAESEGRKLKSREIFVSMVEEVDRAVANVLDAFRETDQLDNTIIIFSSDNGGTHPGKFASNKPLRDGKWWLYEGGVRVPAFIWWPEQIPAGKRTAAILSIMDWYPTFAKMLGQPIRQDVPIDGKDIWQTLTADAPSPHQEGLLINVTNTQNSVIVGDWKLVLNGEHDRLVSHVKLKPHRTYDETQIESVELYNLSTDIGEKNNVALQHPEIVEELKLMIRQSQAQAVKPFRKQLKSKHKKK